MERTLADLTAKLEQLSLNDPRWSILSEVINGLKDEIAARNLGNSGFSRGGTPREVE